MISLILGVEVVVCDFDPCLGEVATGDCFCFDDLRGEAILVEREVVESMFLDVVSRALCAGGHVWCNVVVFSCNRSNSFSLSYSLVGGRRTV